MVLDSAAQTATWRYSLGMSVSRRRPRTSASLRPNMRTAAGFHARILPGGVEGDDGDAGVEDGGLGRKSAPTALVEHCGGARKFLIKMRGDWR